MKILNTYLLILGSLLVSSCGMVGEDAVMTPSYVYIPSYTYVTDSNTQGAASQAYNDMWISNGGTLLGGIGLPSLIPVQSIGATEMRVDAGIAVTGQNDKRRAYPLVASHVEVRNLQAGVVDTIRPVFRYLPNADFKFIEDYDRISEAFRIYNPILGDTIIRVNDNRAWKPGSYSGKIEMSSNHQQLLIVTNQEYTLEGHGSPVYLEIDFKSNMNIDIGFYSSDGSGNTPNSVVQLYPSSTWKKIYVELTDEVSSRPTGTTYKIYIALLNIDNVVPDVYIDNVKLIGLKG